MKQPELARAPQVGDAFADVLGCLGAEAGEGGEAAVGGGLFQVAEGVDVQRLMDQPHLGDAQPGDVQHVDQSRRDLLAQLVEKARAPGDGQLARNLERSLADPLDTGELARPHRLAQVPRILGDGAGGGLEGADAERVVALEGEGSGDLLEDLSDGLLVHGGGT